jgi:hypothetical protein
LGGSSGSILARAESFSTTSFFGLPYYDIVNTPKTRWWYPNLPTIMRSDTSGKVVNVTAAWLTGGYGISRAGCSLVSQWNAWKCSTPTSYRMMVVEDMDADNEMRRIRYVAVLPTEWVVY